ncbi:MAG: methionyl-tRNA formyltransferase [SAR202 cluster bacterium]|nr:methionyl-tRNA formyltransferase [SAR202 cluster bacterium]|tara:strand:+ start:6123 stop:7043 length:921 start_codon:yes stop_codon:yes gene_type:complete
MRISIIGQSAFGKSVLEALAKNNVDEIVGVFAPPTREGRPDDPISESAHALNVPVFEFKRLRDKEAITQFKTVQPELCIMAFVTDIVPMEMINYPILGTIQYHPSLLPLHRGPSSINWPIINGESTTGLTIFWPDNGLDTGPVLMQKTVEITTKETLGDLYFKKLFPLGVEAIIESVELVRSGKAPKIVQDESMATYEGWCKADDVQVKWEENTSTVFNMIRGADPQPGANTTFNGIKLSLYDAAASSDNTAIPGTVVSIGELGIQISTGDGAVNIGRVRESGSGKVTSSEWAESVGLAVGDLLGT